MTTKFRSNTTRTVHDYVFHLLNPFVVRNDEDRTNLSIHDVSWHNQRDKDKVVKHFSSQYETHVRTREQRIKDGWDEKKAANAFQISINDLSKNRKQQTKRYAITATVLIRWLVDSGLLEINRHGLREFHVEAIGLDEDKLDRIITKLNASKPEAEKLTRRKN